MMDTRHKALFLTPQLIYKTIIYLTCKIQN